MSSNITSSDSILNQQPEDYECEECGVQVIAADIPENECRSIAYGCISIAFCKPCYECNWAEHPENPANESKDDSDDDDESDGDCYCSCCSNINTCRDCGYYWGTLEEFESGKGRVAFSYPSCGIEEGQVICCMCYLGVEEYFPADSEEEEEDKHICGETGGEIKGLIGCGGVFDYQDTCMIDNTSFCVECYERIDKESEGECTDESVCEHVGCQCTDTCVHAFGNIALCADHGRGQCIGTSEQENCPVCEANPPLGVEVQPTNAKESQVNITRPSMREKYIRCIRYKT